MWQTDELRRERPNPLDEARSVLYFLAVIVADGVPELFDDIDAVLRSIDGELPGNRVPVRFGSWVGGDRDGNPNVTSETTVAVLAVQRAMALRLLVAEIERLSAELSVSTSVVGVSPELIAALGRERSLIAGSAELLAGREPRRTVPSALHVDPPPADRHRGHTTRCPTPTPAPMCSNEISPRWRHRSKPTVGPRWPTAVSPGSAGQWR